MNRNLIVLLLAGAIFLSNSLISFSNEDSREFFTNWTIDVAAAVALSLSVITVITAYKYKLGTFYTQTYIIFAIGLSLWFIAEVTWSYFQLILQIQTPFPSSADAFWFAGYGFFAYFLFRIYNLLSRASERYLVILAAVATSIILGYTLYLTFGIADLLSSQQGSMKWLISIAYPIIDGILLVPALVIIWNLRDKKLASSHWILLCVSFILVTMADIGFGYSAVIDKVGRKEEWIWDLLYNSSYIVMSAALFLQIKIFARKGSSKIIV